MHDRAAEEVETVQGLETVPIDREALCSCGSFLLPLAGMLYVGMSGDF